MSISRLVVLASVPPRVPPRSPFIGFLVDSDNMAPTHTGQRVPSASVPSHINAPCGHRAASACYYWPVFPSTSVNASLYRLCVDSVGMPPSSAGQCVSLDFRTAPPLISSLAKSGDTAPPCTRQCPPRLPYWAHINWLCV